MYIKLFDLEYTGPGSDLIKVNAGSGYMVFESFDCIGSIGGKRTKIIISGLFQRISSYSLVWWPTLLKSAVKANE